MAPFPFAVVSDVTASYLVDPLAVFAAVAVAFHVHDAGLALPGAFAAAADFDSQD